MEKISDGSLGVIINSGSCNVNKAGFENAHDVIADIVGVKHGFLCLHEVSSWPSDADDEFKFKGWVAQHTAGHPSTILVPHEWWGNIRWGWCAVHAFRDSAQLRRYHFQLYS